MGRRFVLCLHDAGGTVPPMLAIGAELVGRGHEVTVLGQSSVGDRATASGCRFVRLDGPDYRTDVPIEEQVEEVLAVTTGRGPGDDLLRVVADVGAHAVVVDGNLSGAAAAAETAGVPSALLLHSMFRTYVDTWFGELWPLLAPFIDATRAAYGLGPGTSFPGIFAPHDRLYAVVPELFDAPASIPFPPSLLHTGFLVPAAEHAAATEPGPPRVLVSLSTTEMGQGPLLQTILDALDGQDVRALLTGDGSGLRVPSNVEVRAHVPHGVVLPHVDAVITHAGLGTVAAALSHGVPLVCTPIARDQHLNAERVSLLGAGVGVPAAEATAPSIREALERVRREPTFRAAAERLAAASRAAGGAAAVADDLERLTARSR